MSVFHRCHVMSGSPRIVAIGQETCETEGPVDTDMCFQCLLQLNELQQTSEVYFFSVWCTSFVCGDGVVLC